MSRLDVLERAWEQVQSNAGACGVDGITVEAFAKDSQKRLLAVSEQIKQGSYQPQSVKRVWIPKPGSAEKRPLGIPTVRDRVVQTALRMVIEPISLTKRNNGNSLEAIVAKINPILRGWYEYFRHANADALGEMDGWVRGRLRSILRKRRKGRGRGRGSDHHRWGNSYFAELGLFGLKEVRAEELSVSVKEQMC